MKDAAQVLEQVRSAASGDPDAFAHAYENKLQPRVLALGAATLKAPTPEAIEAWLKVFAVVAPLSLEGPSDITAALCADQPEIVGQAETKLSGEEREAIEAFKSGLASKPEPIEASDDLWSAELSPGLPVLVTFQASESLEPTHVELYVGTLTLHDRVGNEIATMPARTGGFIANFKSNGGPTPPGRYVVSNYRPNRFGTPGMTLNGVSFSFDLDPAAGTEVYGRSALRIHPDQAPPGTHGCIGLNGSAVELKDVAAKLNSLLSAGKFLLQVSYAA